MYGSHLPDGCCQAEIDRLINGPDEEPEDPENYSEPERWRYTLDDSGPEVVPF